jgi:hypothetical protein
MNANLDSGPRRRDIAIAAGVAAVLAVAVGSYALGRARTRTIAASGRIAADARATGPSGWASSPTGAGLTANQHGLGIPPLHAGAAGGDAVERVAWSGLDQVRRPVPGHRDRRDLPRAMTQLPGGRQVADQLGERVVRRLERVVQRTVVGL